MGEVSRDKNGSPPPAVKTRELVFPRGTLFSELSHIPHCHIYCNTSAASQDCGKYRAIKMGSRRPAKLPSSLLLPCTERRRAPYFPTPRKVASVKNTET